MGRKLVPKLQALNINTAADLAQADWRVMREQFSIVVAKTARELFGESCLEWEEVPADTMCGRFSQRETAEIYAGFRPNRQAVLEL